MNAKEHILTVFDDDLREVQTMIMAMGGFVEQAIAEAAAALESRDLERAQSVIETDRKIDELEEAINTAVVRIIALRQPQASDLRMVITVMKVAGNLERVGDYAKNIAKRATVLVHGQPIEGSASSVRRLAKTVRLMLKDALDAYAQRDAELAQDIRARDRDVDQMHSALFREFLTHMMEDPRNITPCMHLLFIAKNLERMGDHVTSIAEQVLFLVEGEMPHGERAKDDTTPFLDDEEMANIAARKGEA